MHDPLIDKTIQYLNCLRDDNDISIKHIVLGSYFTVVELSDNNVGAVMSYYNANHLINGGLMHIINDVIANDPQLLTSKDGFSHSIFNDWKNDHQFSLACACILCALTSALSQPYLSTNKTNEFIIHKEFPYHSKIFDSKSALVIGFGGYLPFLIKETSINNIYVCDLSYKTRYEEMNSMLRDWLIDQPEKKITFFDSFEDHADKEYDLLSITGSSLCNGTLSQILNAHKNSFNIVQGQSAGIFPKFLFEAGVDMVSTTIKPRAIVKDAQKDLSGKFLTQYFEGGLPFIYLLPN
ncbi:hypothetical protein GCM10011344_11700 [Dokdonia pacifica]|uniref:Putative heavy-metal chelation n=1 Tax=Dokdonia pacifica TaxID=1627892 RepID=A0A238YEW9_9FLAO|nr:DUF364 domain-containing protein [Dokdonia pacifica]GGG12639.1 hypothetical protein GCM10011344_11700 [Dokdonia pacifica]SNR69785.1 Putative heavy-metal chelation [Dokdonia pacifica]